MPAQIGVSAGGEPHGAAAVGAAGAGSREASVAEGASGAAAARVRRPDWVAHVLDEEADPPQAVLLHLPSGRRTGLSPTATRIWQEIVATGQKGADQASLADKLAPEYGTTPSAIALDIEALLVEMVTEDWLEAVPPGGDVGTDAGMDAEDEGGGS